jgi:peptidoglycan-associated lipoprotein
MVGDVKFHYFASLVGALFIFVGCATETTQKPGGQASSATTSNSGRGSTQKSSASAPRATTGSSLDAHREGKSATTGPLKEIRFEFDSYNLTPEARSVLKTNAAWLKTNPSANVEIEGHCDERGTTEYNLALGAKRARAAMDYLVTLGVVQSRIKTTSYGEELPVCKESSEGCFEKNRRDRFVDVRARPAL